MALIKRLDHIIVAVRDRQQWIPTIQRVLALEPGRMLEGAGEGASGFGNAEFAIGDGFLGVVEPAGEASQLHRFLDRSGDGFYAMSIDVGDVPAATASFESTGARYQSANALSLTWLGPRGTHGVLYQVIGGMLLGPGTNPRYLGVSTMTIVVADLDTAVADYRTTFGFGAPTPVTNDRFGYRGAVLAIEGSTLDDTIVLAQPVAGDTPTGRHLAERGEGIFSFGITVDDLAGELARLASIDVGVEVDELAGATHAHIDPVALKGLRVELVAPTGS
jgi:hypothetical protein